MDICVLALGVMIIVLLLGVVLSRRHGHARASAAVIGALLLSLAAALVGYLLLNKSLEAKPDTSAEWHKMTVLGRRATGLRYQSGAGLLATTDDGETNPIRDIPFCLANGKLAQRAPNFIETTNNPYITLPQPPRPFKQQISFNLSYAINTTGLAASSFGIDENGELWCTEKLYQASRSGATAVGSASLTTLYVVIIIFAGSFAVMAIPAAVILEIRRGRKGMIRDT